MVPVFITLDPARDSCEQVGAYVRDFHPRMIGLTGTPEQISVAARAYRVFFSEVDKKTAESEDYLGESLWDRSRIGLSVAAATTVGASVSSATRHVPGSRGCGIALAARCRHVRAIPWLHHPSPRSGPLHRHVPGGPRWSIHRFLHADDDRTGDHRAYRRAHAKTHGRGVAAAVVAGRGGRWGTASRHGEHIEVRCLQHSFVLTERLIASVHGKVCAMRATAAGSAGAGAGVVLQRSSCGRSPPPPCPGRDSQLAFASLCHRRNEFTRNGGASLATCSARRAARGPPRVGGAAGCRQSCCCCCCFHYNCRWQRGRRGWCRCDNERCGCWRAVQGGAVGPGQRATLRAHVRIALGNRSAAPLAIFSLFSPLPARLSTRLR